MRIEQLYIKNFKNLKEFSIDFDKEALTSVVVGRNATGKSNLMEALVTIFRDLDLEPEAGSEFSYQLRYSIRDKIVEIDSDRSRSSGKVTVSIDSGKPQSAKILRDSSQGLLPETVFAYYSGDSNRLEHLFDRHLLNFRNAMIEGDINARPRLIYGRLIHSQFALLSFFSEKDQDALSFLAEELGILDLQSVLFVLNQPYWARSKKQSVSTGGDPRFWGARGVVSEFLSRLYKKSLAPLRLSQKVKTEIGSAPSREHLYLFLKDKPALEDLVASIAEIGDIKEAGAFFRTLESAYVSDLIPETRIRVEKRNIDGGITFRELSEGEQQLLMVLGLLRFTKNEESLFLLDEPDTHLNPAWGQRYLKLIERAVGPYPSSQIIMATHDPLVFSGLTRNEVRIIAQKDEGGEIKAIVPSIDPKGLGVAGILMSEFYDLPSQLDIETQEIMEERTRLLAKGEKRTPKETERMRELTNEISNLGFTKIFRDPLYTQFVQAMAKREEFTKPKLTQKDIDAQEEIAAEILENILKKEGK
jgi:predicted ATPase